MAAGAALDGASFARGGQLVACAQDPGRLADPERRVVQPRAATRRQCDVVDAGLAQQPGAGDALVGTIRGDVLRAAKAQAGPEPEGRLEPGCVQVDVVEPQDRRTAMQVE